MKANTAHIYEYKEDHIVDCFGDEMYTIDEYVDELNMLMDEIRELKIKLENAELRKDTERLDWVLNNYHKMLPDLERWEVDERMAKLGK